MNQMRTILQAIKEGFMLIGGAELTTEVPHSIVILQGQATQEVIQFLEAVADLRRVDSWDSA